MSDLHLKGLLSKQQICLRQRLSESSLMSGRGSWKHWGEVELGGAGCGLWECGITVGRRGTGIDVTGNLILGDFQQGL